MKYALVLALAASPLLAACSSESDSGKEPTGTTQPPPTNTPTPTTTGDDPCGLNSGFPGDEYCILPPAPGEGIQIHAGPASYTDQETVAPWLINPGEENTRCFLARIPESGFYYLKQKNRMRGGSHHMLITLATDKGQAEGPAAVRGLGRRAARFRARKPRARDFPEQLGPEDAGLARYLPAGTSHLSSSTT